MVEVGSDDFGMDPAVFGQYLYATPQLSIARRPIFISGVARSGTTLLGKLVGSLADVEYCFEPLMLAHISALTTSGLIPEPVAASLLAGVLDEILYEYLLGRGVNLRPEDDSRFWLMKPYDELVRRWRQAPTRNEAQMQVQKEGIRLAAKSPDLAYYYGFLLRAFPQGYLINITRNGFAVAASTTKKRWLHDESLDGLIGRVPMRLTAGGRRVQYWVAPEAEERYLGYDAATRALFKWRTLVEEAERQKEALGVARARVLDLRFETLVTEPDDVLEQVLDFLGGAQPTLQTEQILRSLHPDRARQTALAYDCYHPDELAAARLLMQRLGYEG